MHLSHEHLVDLVGKEAADKLRSEYGGLHIFIGKGPKEEALATTVPMPAIRVSGRFDAQTSVHHAVESLVGCLHVMQQNGVHGLVVDVETTGVGQAYLELLTDLLSRFGVQAGVMESAGVQAHEDGLPTMPVPTPTDGRQSTGGAIDVSARIVRCRHGQPLVVLDDRPFNGLEIRPHDLDRLGEHLIAIARLAKQHKGRQPTTVVMG